MKKDFFISYNQADREVAVWIAQQLEGAGYSTIIQAEDMPPGSNFVLEMHRATTEAARTIAVLSPDFLQSQFTQPEWAAAFAKDPTSANRTLLPVRVRECQPTGLLAQIVYIDLVGKTGAEARQLLLAGLNRERERLSLPVRFPVDELLERYCQHLAARVSTVRIFGDEAPHPLDQVFVELSLNEEYERRPNQAEFLGLMDRELRRRRSVFGDTDERREQDSDDPTQRHFVKTKRTLKPDELLRRHTHAVITGAPGCGKTTLLRYLAWQTLKQWRDAFVVPPSGGSSGTAAPNRLASEPLPPEGGTTNTRLPVFLELKQLTTAAFQQAQGQLEDLLFNTAIAARLKPNEAERAALQQHFHELLRAGRVAVFLDGLDEVSGAGFFGDLQKMVSEFLQSAYGHNTVIISTRPYALRPFGHTKMLEILPLNPRQIEQFITHYYRDVPERQQFQRELQRRRELRELARVPALLGFILQLWRKRGSVTDDKLELYEQITLELAQQLDREKEGLAPDRQWLVEDKDGSLKLDLLRQLAFNQLFKGLIRPPYDIGSTDNDATRLVFTGEQLRDDAIAFARALKEREGLILNPRNLAEDVKATALLRQVGADHYAFAHLTLQEYLAAWQLAKRDNGDTCERIFCRAYFNPTLAEMEVLPMTLGLVNKPDVLYEALEQLPESLDFKGLRVRARGLSYRVGISLFVLEVLINKLIEFVSNSYSEDLPYLDLVVQSFSGMTDLHAEEILSRVRPFLRLDEKDSSLRSQAIDTLGKLGSDRAIPTLIMKLKVDQDVNVKRQAAKILGEFGDERANAAILDLIDSNEDGRCVAAEALGGIPADWAQSCLLSLFKDENFYVRVTAINNCGGNWATPALIEALKDTHSFVRMRSAFAIGRIADQTAKGAILKSLNDEDELVRYVLAQMLGRFDGEDVLSTLLDCWNGNDDSLCQGAIKGLSHLYDTRLIDSFLDALKHEDENVRYQAARALKKYNNHRILPALLHTLKDKSWLVRAGVIETIAQFGDERSIEALLEALDDGEDSVRIDAAQAVAIKHYEQAFQTLKTLVKNKDTDEDSDLRADALKALGKIGGAPVVSILLEFLKDEWRDVLFAAVESLSMLDHKTLTLGIRQTLSCPNGFAREKAVSVAGYYLNDEKVYEDLLYLSATDSEKEVRVAANKALPKFERKLQYFDIPSPPIAINDHSQPSPVLLLTAQERTDFETQITTKYQEVLRGGDARQKGKALEALLAALFATIPGFTISERNYHTAPEELDLVLHNTSADPFWRGWGSFILVEAKHWQAQRVGKNEYVQFYRKLETRGGHCQLGFLICTEWPRPCTAKPYAIAKTACASCRLTVQTCGSWSRRRIVKPCCGFWSNARRYSSRTRRAALQCGQIQRKELDAMANVAYEQALEVVRALAPEEQQKLLREIKAERAQQAQSVNGGAKVVHQREREMRWFADEQNCAKYGGQWVALDGEQLLSHGTDLRQVYAEARAKGVEVPFTGYVDPLDALPFGGW